MIQTILWDVDGTLLDFGAAERAAMTSLYRDFGLGTCTEDALRRYSQLNKTYWERLERREITKPELLVRRFQDFFGAEGLSVDAAAFNAAYQARLGETAIPRDDSVALVTSLRGRVRQYVVSNGTVQAQTAKLRRSGLDRLMDGIFLSEKIGAEKPDIAFFDAVFAAIGPVEKEEVLIVGTPSPATSRAGKTPASGPAGTPPPAGKVPSLTIPSGTSTRSWPCCKKSEFTKKKLLGAGTFSALSCKAILRKPQPCKRRSKICRTTGAVTGSISRTCLSASLFL